MMKHLTKLFFKFSISLHAWVKNRGCEGNNRFIVGMNRYSLS